MFSSPASAIFCLTDTLMGTVITQVTGNDVDSGPALSYTLHLDAKIQGVFGIHRYGGGVSLTGLLDYEDRTWYTLTVRSSDSVHQSEANITVLVDDVNDNAPTFTQDSYQVVLPDLSSPIHIYHQIFENYWYLSWVCAFHMDGVFLIRSLYQSTSLQAVQSSQ